ncbi:MAG: divergent polysaccharide deacetylase family protein [Gammaproteobacteria bacterium]|nr:divergent polysaccharide deacetylase family protein [Gammaproteobacteria bacterium]
MKNTTLATYLLLSVVVSLFISAPLSAENGKQALISIVIDDIGYRLHEDLRAIGLPGQVAFAIMPHSPHAGQMSALANELGKDVLLHLPMQATSDDKNRFLGPGALTLQMTHSEFIQVLDSSLRSVPHASGVNNHMGSLLTRHPGHMAWLMESLKSRNKYYLDSVTSNRSVAINVAREMALPHLRRDVFLDNIQNDEKIETQFDELISIAKRKGYAIAIGHPYPETMSVLSRKLLLLDKIGVKLISPRDMLARKKGTASLHKISLQK